MPIKIIYTYANSKTKNHTSKSERDRNNNKKLKRKKKKERKKQKTATCLMMKLVQVVPRLVLPRHQPRSRDCPISITWAALLTVNATSSGL